MEDFTGGCRWNNGGIAAPAFRDDGLKEHQSATGSISESATTNNQPTSKFWRFGVHKGLRFRTVGNTALEMAQWTSEQEYHDWLLAAQTDKQAAEAKEEAGTAPIFSASVLRAATDQETELGRLNLLPQYGLLADHISTCKSVTPDTEPNLSEDNRLFLNVNAPWSAFICGSQGSGKSHTLSCILENGLLQSEPPARLGKLPKPLAGMVFHYDKFTGLGATQVCEAAYLCSEGIPVKVLVSPSNLKNMVKAYTEIKGLPKGARPTVMPLELQDRHLNAGRMKKLMSMDSGDAPTPLYMEVVSKVLREVAMTREASEGLDYDEFEERLKAAPFDQKQRSLLEIRLDLLRSFMEPRKKTPKTRNKKKKESEKTWAFEPGSLTIVDLSCPFVDEDLVCALFDMCLAIFLEKRDEGDCMGRIVALDEAHKFLTGTGSAQAFTESLLSVIRQQRHLATRVIISTQEPTISPKLLDLSSMTIVHRFGSWEWLQMLKYHIAAVSMLKDDQGQEMRELFDQIVALKKGQAFLFAPTALLGLQEGGKDGRLSSDRLGGRYLKMRVRNRVTQDGGRTQLAVG
ncbi:MAG: hypothetical protein Q9191_000068 [Dirinaria sp. TL-2023a]